MVVVTVAEYNRIDSRQVYTESFCILYNCIRLPRVEQEFMLLD